MQNPFLLYVDGVILTPEIIRAGRKDIRLTLAKFAGQVGVATEPACRWETGRMKPSLYHGRKIIQVFRSTPPPAGQCPADAAQEDGQLTAQNTVPPVQAQSAAAGRSGTGRPVSSGRQDDGQFTLVEKRVLAVLIGEKVEEYIAGRK